MLTKSNTITFKINFRLLIISESQIYDTVHEVYVSITIYHLGRLKTAELT